MCSVIHGNVHCNTSAVYFSTLQVHVQCKTVQTCTCAVLYRACNYTCSVIQYNTYSMCTVILCNANTCAVYMQYCTIHAHVQCNTM